MMPKTSSTPLLRYAGKLIGAPIEGTTSFTSEPGEPIPHRPVSTTVRFSKKMTKKQARELRMLLHPLSRPAHVSPKKKVAWRLQRKWFNRYEKPRMIGSVLTPKGAAGTILGSYRIKDVHISRGGARLRNMKLTLSPQ